ncbi:MAG: hypothetical protein Q9209_007358 [Squamulea sp. 1 TL-2023]
MPEDQSNGRIPAIVDRTPTSDGNPRQKRIFESGALMLYLCQNYDPGNKLSYAYDTDEYWEVVEWLIWIKPLLSLCSREIEYGIKRYRTETKPLYQVLIDRPAEQVKLAGKDAPWIVGDRMTNADIANFSWVNWAEWAGIDVKSFKLLKQWLDRINERPAVKRGLDVPEPFTMKEMLKSKVCEEQ